MVRNLHVYPRASLTGSSWSLIVNVYEPATKVTSRFPHTIPAGVVGDLHELKLSNGKRWKTATVPAGETFSVNAGGQVRYESDVPEWRYR